MIFISFFHIWKEIYTFIHLGRVKLIKSDREDLHCYKNLFQTNAVQFIKEILKKVAFLEH